MWKAENSLSHKDDLLQWSIEPIDSVVEQLEE